MSEAQAYLIRMKRAGAIRPYSFWRVVMFTSEQSCAVIFRGRKRMTDRIGLLCFA